jgi:hypothetical protein
LKETHPRTIPARFGLIWFRGFRGEDLNVKVYDGTCRTLDLLEVIRPCDFTWYMVCPYYPLANEVAKGYSNARRFKCESL